ncbi:ATP-binding protein [Roseibium sp. HPY-6]|uniref:hybrid sensor histidine kinase/response regulator n=1 Tax=Roseibium sp. HPY-6 TaxID=3229852 RepID=UPI00338F67E8
MLNLKALIETHEEWLTDRVVHYAQLKGYTQNTSTLREAWRISICGLSAPLVQLIDIAQSSPHTRETAIKGATSFGVSQGLKHRSLGIELIDFIGLLKLYRKAYVELVTENECAGAERESLENTILELFDSMELGILTAWMTSEVTAQIAELQQSNRALSNEKNKYLTVFESIDEPSIVLDEENRPTHVNAAANRLLLGEIKPGAGYYGELNNPLLYNVVKQILAAGSDKAESVTLETPNGQRKFNIAIQRMLDVSEKFVGQVIVLQDVTDYLKAIEAAQSADRAKSVFLTTISHEIRTPINSILGLTGLLEDQSLPEEKRKQIRSIRASGEMLSALIENVLGLSRAQTNALQLVEQDFNLDELCVSLFQVLQLNDLDQQVKLERQLDPDVPLQLYGDGPKLRHILLNLLSNALKYTKEGTVSLHVSRLTPKSEMRPTLHFEVIDTGIGIHQDEVEELFKPFSQGLRGLKSNAEPGSGLGLAISKHLVEFLGGEIRYQPNRLGGSVFSFSLKMDTATNPKVQTEYANGLTVLVVEDDPVNAMVIEGYLTELGHEAITVDTFHKAVNALETSQIDVVVTDFRLGEKTGLDVAQAVWKTNQSKGSGIHVIVVTAAIPHEALIKLKHYETSFFLEKPFSRYQFANALSSVLSSKKTINFKQSENSVAYISKTDLNRLLSDLGFERFEAVVQSYLTNMPQLVIGMKEAIQTKDYPAACDFGHRLISASGFVGANRIVQLTKEFKALCSIPDEPAAHEKFSELENVSELTTQALDASWKYLLQEM